MLCIHIVMIDSRCTSIIVVLVAVVGVMNLLEGSESTLTLQQYILLSTLLSRGLNIRVEVKVDRFLDCEVR